MDIAVLSDIHGNYVALRRCVDFALERNIKRPLFSWEIMLGSWRIRRE